MSLNTAIAKVKSGGMQSDYLEYIHERADYLYTPSKRTRTKRLSKLANGHIQRLPLPFQQSVAVDLLEEFEEKAYKRGVVEAALGLEKQARKSIQMMPCGLFLNSDDDAIIAKAETISKNIEKKRNRSMLDYNDIYGDQLSNERENEAILLLAIRLHEESCRYLAAVGIEPAALKGKTVQDYMAVVKRACCPKWMRRKLRQEHARFVELYGMNLGQVRRDRQCYVTDKTMQTRHDQIKRNQSILENLIAYSEETQEVFFLADCAEASISNPVNRRNETMTRLRGMEDFAKAKGQTATFLTITCPSRFHRYTKLDGMIEDNPKFDGSSPRVAHHYLVELWALMRTALNDLELSYSGFRIAEPHHDGCPHWHMLVFGDASTLAIVEKVLEHYALREDPDEAGAAKHRFTAKRIDTSKGSAVGYVAKYIAKHLDGCGMDNDLDESGQRIQAAIARVDAWRSVWGLRQFQFFGSPAITAWRQLRRIAEKPDGAIADAWVAAQSADHGGAEDGVCFEKYLDAIAKEPIRIIRENTGELGYYGEEIEDLVGLECGGSFYLTHTKKWQVFDGREASALGLVSITVGEDGKKVVTMKNGGKPPD